VTVVGRREYCDILIDDVSLSKRHCVLVKTEGLLIIRDLATTNGTKVKGQKIKWAALLPEDKISLGSVKFKVYLGPDDVLSPSEAAAKGVAPPIDERPSTLFPIPSKNSSTRSKTAKPKPSPVHVPAEDDLPILLDEGAWDLGGDEEIIDLE
jgi:pSer/pThr/pTyr-binding forkhead associated (FHA) protein